MASDAGRVIPLPKGAWDISRNYEVLDIVNHKNQSWMAKLPSIGIEPTEGQFWTMYGSSVQKASTDAMGIVKIPSDGSMTIDADGTIGVTVDDALDKTSDMPIANSAVAEAIEGVTASIDGKLTPSVVSDAYNPDKTYAVGEYCIYNDVLWKCKVLSKGVAPAEGATWDKCSVSGEISSLNNVLANKNSIKITPYDATLCTFDYAYSMISGHICVINSQLTLKRDLTDATWQTLGMLNVTNQSGYVIIPYRDQTNGEFGYFVLVGNQIIFSSLTLAANHSYAFTVTFSIA